jgi:hypothetical protein
VALLRLDEPVDAFLQMLGEAHPASQVEPASTPALQVLAQYYMQRHALLSMLLTMFKLTSSSAAAQTLVRELLHHGVVGNLLKSVQSHTEAVRALLSRRDAVGLGVRLGAMLCERRMMAECVFVSGYYSTLSTSETTEALHLAARLSDANKSALPHLSSSQIMSAPTARGNEWVVREQSFTYECLYLVLLALLASLGLEDDAVRLPRGPEEDLRLHSHWMAAVGEGLAANEFGFAHDAAMGVCWLAWGLFLKPRQGSGDASQRQASDLALGRAFELRALAFLRLAVASPEFRADELRRVLAGVVYSAMMRTAEANRTARLSLTARSDDEDEELDRDEPLRPRLQLLDTPSGPLPDSLEGERRRRLRARPADAPSALTD